MVFNVDEVIVFNESGKASNTDTSGDAGRKSDANTQLARILQYLECPQYLRKSFFPRHPDLQYAGTRLSSSPLIISCTQPTRITARQVFSMPSLSAAHNQLARIMARKVFFHALIISCTQPTITRITAQKHFSCPSIVLCKARSSSLGHLHQSGWGEGEGGGSSYPQALHIPARHL